MKLDDLSFGQKVLILFPDARPGRDVVIQDDSDGEGPYVKFWNESVLGPELTEAQVDAAIVQKSAEG